MQRDVSSEKRHSIKVYGWFSSFYNEAKPHIIISTIRLFSLQRILPKYIIKYHCPDVLVLSLEMAQFISQFINSKAVDNNLILAEMLKINMDI